MTGIAQSVKAYEGRLRERLGTRLVEKDLVAKHKGLEESLFGFLRGTCWRWMETAPELCPQLMEAPPVASVVDSHVGNFGLWRDVEGRLVWGVNDFDEAAPAPWPLDLVRLAASALIALDGEIAPRDVAGAILDGYARGLERPRPYVLERGRQWLRALFSAGQEEREHFWAKLLALPRARRADRAFTAALRAALPEGDMRVDILSRQAGVGSLGRLRLVAATADWRGAPAAREAKAVVPSCCDPKGTGGAGYAYAFGRHRAPDPWMRCDGDILVRRLAPDSRKLDLDDVRPHLRRRLLRAMARDIAAVHASAPPRKVAAVRADLEGRGKGWLAAAAREAVKATERDWRAYRG